MATFEAATRRLTIDMADGQTTANTVMAAVIAEGTFRAELDRSSDPTNDGSGTIVAPAGAAATTSGGTAETLAGTDTNPIETQGVFNSLIRLYDAVDKYDVDEDRADRQDARRGLRPVDIRTGGGRGPRPKPRRDHHAGTKTSRWN